MQTWRLLLDDKAPGAWNMAVDLVILEAMREGAAPPTVRLYDWIRPTLSLGYAQRLDDVRLEACHEDGLDLVRRPTGGRAVLHGAGDYTYAIVASEQEGFPASVSGAYARIARALARALAHLDLQVTVAPGSHASGLTRACFATATKADLTAQGKKLVGSSQLRREGGFLQHGALMVSQEPDAITPYLHGARPPHMTHLQALLGQAPAIPRLQAALIKGFEEEFAVRLAPGELSARERQLATERMAEFALAAGA